MSDKLLNLSVNVDKITPTRLYKGKKGRYLNLTVKLSEEPDEYGNHANIWESQTEEERKSKVDRNFLGSGKTIWEDTEKKQEKDQEDDLPW